MKSMNVRKCMTVVMIEGALVMSMLFSGCGKKDVDYQLDGNSESYRDNADIDGELAEKLGVPQSCEVSIDTGRSGLQSIMLKDDAIEVPESDSMSVFYYEKICVDSNYKQAIAESLFDKEQGIYEYKYRIKSEIEEEIANVKEQQENLISQGYIDLWYDAYIEELEKQLQDAPVEYPPAGDYSGFSFIGSMNGQEYGFGIYTEEDIDSPIVNAFLAPRNEFLYRPYEGATYGYCLEGPSAYNFSGINLCKITQEEAIDVAEDFLIQCGTTDMIPASICVLEWSYSDQSTGEEIATEYDGYVIRFNRAINNTLAYKGEIYDADNLSMKDSSIDLPIESYIVYVDDHGIVEAYWTVIFSKTEEEEKNVELLSWNEMLVAANKNISEFYEKYPTNYKKIEFNDVRLTYYPAVDENKENSYKYIPVWVFRSMMSILILKKTGILHSL